MPRLEHFENVLIVPYTQLLDAGRGGSAHRGGPIWPDWDKQTVVRHCRKWKPCDHPPAPLPPEDELAEPIAWGGPIANHFGHQIAEFSTRILPTLSEWPDAVFAFSGALRRNITSLETAPQFFPQMLDWFGVPPGRTRILIKPTLATSLWVMPQGEQLGGVGPDPGYLDMLDELTRRRFGTLVREGMLYVSRAGQRACLAGEAYLETALAQAGVAVFRPENFPLAEQLRRYASAERLLFAEGSALHGTQLLGRSLGHVSVLCRRPASKIAHAFVQPRARSLEYLDFGVKVIHGLDRSGALARNQGITALDEALLLDGLENLGVSIKRRWDSQQYRSACENDIGRWLRGGLHGPRGSVPGSREKIMETLAESGFGFMAREFEVVV